MPRRSSSFFSSALILAALSSAAALDAATSAAVSDLEARLPRGDAEAAASSWRRRCANFSGSAGRPSSRACVIVTGGDDGKGPALRAPTIVFRQVPKAASTSTKKCLTNLTGELLPGHHVNMRGKMYACSDSRVVDAKTRGALELMVRSIAASRASTCSCT